MPGEAAVAIWCDVGPDLRDEFDDCHGLYRLAYVLTEAK